MVVFLGVVFGWVYLRSSVISILVDYYIVIFYKSGKRWKGGFCV